MSIPVMGIPILNRGDLLLRLFESIDYPVDILHIIINHTSSPAEDVESAVHIIQGAVNGGHEFVRQLVFEGGLIKDSDGEIVTHNMGVAGSWNRIIEQHVAYAPYIMLVGNDIMFTPGDLQRFDDYMSTMSPERRDKKGITCGNHGYSCFAILPETINTLGYFDENIYPAYLEDCDYSYRCKLAGLDNSDVQNTHMVHGEAPLWGSSTIHSNNAYLMKNGMTHHLNFKEVGRGASGLRYSHGPAAARQQWRRGALGVSVRA